MEVIKINKKITFIIGSMRRGGAERVISLLANHYAEKNWEVNILTLLNNKVQYKLHSNVNVIDFSSNLSRILMFPKWVYSIRKYFIENNPDKVVSFVARINIITLLSSLGLDLDIIISERNDPKSDGRSIIVKALTFILYRLARIVIFQTKSAKSYFPQYIQSNSLIISNPIEIKKSASDIKKKKIVSVGRLESQKNHKLLIDAFNIVHKSYPKYELYIYGEGILKGELLQQIENYNLLEKVFLKGNVSNIHEHISDAEMFVLSSDYEGLSNALLESMFMGIPSISTNCAGSNEVIINEENGLLVPIGEMEPLADAMIYLIENEELRRKISTNSIKLKENFKLDIIMDKWEIAIENRREEE